MRLYVDCDMTLILWKDVGEEGEFLSHPWEGAEHYDINWDLVAAIREFIKMYPTTGLTVWSGGGFSYALRWSQLTGLGADGVMAKDISVPDHGDICIDDQDLKVHGRLMLPKDFIAMVGKYKERNKIFMRAASDDTHDLAVSKGIYTDFPDT